MSTVPIPRTYSLTELVGRRANEGRTATIATFEFQRRHGAIVAAAAVPAILIGLVAGTIIGVYGILFAIAVEFAAFILFERRTRDGLQLRTWEALNDRRVADTGRMFICGVEVDPSRIDVIQVLGGSVPVERSAQPRGSATAAPRKPEPVTTAVTPAPGKTRRRRRGEDVSPPVSVQAEALAAAFAGREGAPAQATNDRREREDAWSEVVPTATGQPARTARKELSW